MIDKNTKADIINEMIKDLSADNLMLDATAKDGTTQSDKDVIKDILLSVVNCLADSKTLNLPNSTLAKKLLFPYLLLDDLLDEIDEIYKNEMYNKVHWAITENESVKSNEREKVYLSFVVLNNIIKDHIIVFGQSKVNPIGILPARKEEG